jgi:lysophospholipase L1-like esterase
MKKQLIVCFGDSITEGQGLPDAHRWTTRLAFLLEEKFPGRFEIHNRGVGGNTTALALDRIQSDVIPLLPAIVLLVFGINDAYVFAWSAKARVSLAEFRINLDEMIRQLTARSGRPFLIVNHPVTPRTDLHQQGNGKSIASNLRDYNAAIRSAAKTHRLGLLNFPHRLEKKKLDYETLLSKDGVHLSAQGNRIYAELVFEEMTTMFKRSVFING